MCLVAQPLGFGNDELALVDRAWSRIEPIRDKRWSQQGLFSVGRIFSQLVCHRGIVAAAVVARRPWNWRCVIGMKSKALDGFCLHGWNGHRMLDGWRLANSIKREPKRFTKGRQCPFGGIGFRSLEGGVVHLTG